MADAHSNQLELAWAAGLFEGEGCILADADDGRGRPRVRLYLSTTDKDVIEHFARVVGVGTIRFHPRYAPEHPQYKDLWAWQISGKAAEAPLRALLPWLGERRTAKAHAALGLIPNIGPENRFKTHCVQGHPYDRANTGYRQDGARRCLACERRRNRESRLAKQVV